MKNIKAWGLIVLALLVGLAAAVYAARWAARQGEVALGQVVVAAVDIEPGSRLSPQMLAVQAWPSGALPQGAFGDAKALHERVLKVGVLKGEAIVERKLAPAGALGGLSAVIAEGKRAMTVRVNDVVGVAGFALPGTYVDVMVNTHKDGAGRGEESQISKTVLEQVLVLAVAQEASRDDTKPKVVSAVTLELSPQDAERLDLARSVGTLSLVLRNQADRQSALTSGSTKRQLLGEAPAAVVRTRAAVAPASAVPVRRAEPPRQSEPPRQAEPAPRPCVELIQNTARVLHCF